MIDLKNKIQNRFYDSNYRNTDSVTYIDDTVVSGAGGGGSCFPKDTLIRTQLGYTPIQNLRVDDIILSYDRFGKIGFSKIEKVHVHVGKEIRDDLFYFNNDLLVCTGNHALYDHTTNEHKLAHEFKVGDYLTNMNGELIKITHIKRIAFDTLPSNFEVFNFEVDPHHTFLAGTPDNWIKVHNGGGGKSGQTRAAQESPNTLQSSAIVKVLEVISEGEIVGVVGGAKGVKLNATPIKNSDGSLNFPSASYEERFGLPSQTYIPGFDDIRTEQAKAVDVTNATPVAQSVIGSNVDAVQVTLSLPEGLWLQNTTNGDLTGYSVEYAIDTRTTAGTWSEIIRKTLSGKTTTAYEFSHRVDNPGTAGWDIRIRRISADDSLASQKSKLRWARWTEIQEILETYPDTAYVGLTVSAESVGNQIPTRSFDVQGIKVQIPSNYDPVTKEYTGAWDGTFSTAWTDNPAWILYDLITNTRYGVATYLNQPVNVDKWEFYNCGVYSDVLVPNGSGGYEARFTFNSVIQTQTVGWQLLHAIASTMRANIGMNGNQITLIQDRPVAASKIITNGNVIDGMFTYGGSDANERITAVNVTFNDKNDFYLPRTISLENNTSGNDYTVNYGNGTDIWGYNVQDFVAFGAVTESQALRMARWILYTEAKQADTVTFSMGLNTVDVGVGDVVKVMDNDYISDSNKYYSGRISSVSGTTITLSNPVDISGGGTYILGIANRDNDNIIEKTITGQSGYITGQGYTILTIDSALPTGDYVEHDFLIYSIGTIEPRQFKIIAVTEQEKGKFTLSGIFYDPDKWATVEDGLTVTTVPYSKITLNPVVDRVSNVIFTVTTRNDDANGKKADISMTWEHTDPNIVEYQIRYQRDNQGFGPYEKTTTKSFSITNVTNGQYEFGITAVRFDGKKSLELLASPSAINQSDASSLYPPVNFYVKDTTGTTFNTRDLTVSWDEDSRNVNQRDTTAQYRIDILTSTDTLIRSVFIDYTITQWTYYYPDMVSDTNADRNIYLELYAVDSLGRVSTTTAKKTFNNPVPATITMSVASDDAVSYVNLTSNSGDPDVSGFVVHRSTTSGFTPTDANKVYDGPDKSIALKSEAATTYYYKSAAYDDFGKTGLNFTSQYTNTTTAKDAGYIFTYTGLDFTVSGNTLYWTAGTCQQMFGTTKQTKNISAGNATWSSGVMYVYYTYGATTLTTTTSYTTALSYSNDIVAVYKGGNDLLVSDGKPIIDGNKIIAQSIGANQLSSGLLITNSAQIGSAIIEEGHLSTASVGNANIKDYIQSSDYNATNKTGWKVDKAGNIITYGTLAVYDTNGNVVLTTGANAGVEWSKVQGTGKPENNATAGANYNTNVTNIPYDEIYNNDDSVAMGFNPTFSAWTGTYPDGWGNWAGTIVKETTTTRVGKYAIRYNSLTANAGIARTLTFYNSPLPVDTFVSGTVDIYMPSRTSGYPGILVDLIYDSSGNYQRLTVPVNGTNVNTWYRVPWTARLSKGRQIFGLRIYIMASYSGMTGGQFNGSVIFDNLRFALFDNSTDNRSVTIANDGTLSGAGGGQVTITGLGYSGDLNATHGADGSNLNVAEGGNVVPNSDFASPIPDSQYRWLVGWNQGGGTNYTIARDTGGDDWRPSGGHNLGLYRSGSTLAASGNFDIKFEQRFKVAAGLVYDFSCYAAAHRGTSSAFIYWFTTDLTAISTSFIGTTTKTGGKDMNNWGRLSGLVTAPTNAVWAEIRLRAYATNDKDPYNWWTKIFFGRAKSGQTQPSPWSAAGAAGAFANVDQINSSNVGVYIANAAIQSAQMGTASIDTLHLKNGVVSDVRFGISNTAKTIATITTGPESQSTNISPQELYSFTWTTPNPSGVSGPFNTYIQGMVIPSIEDSSTIQTNGTYEYYISSTMTINIRVVKVSDGSVAYSSTAIPPASGFSNTGITQTNGTVSITANLSGGSNIIFGSTTLAPNTQYRVSVYAVGGALKKTVTSSDTSTVSCSTNIALVVNNMGIYLHTLLR